MARRTHPDAPRLADLSDDFDRYFAERHWHRWSDRSLERLPSAEDLWQDLLTTSPRQPAFRLVKAGETTKRTGTTRSVGFGNRSLGDVIDPQAVVANYRAGDTVVIQGLQHTNPRLAKLATNLALDLDHPIQINAYLSPAHHQGLNVHFDFHDVLVVQLAGTKHWTVYPPLLRSIDALKSDITIASPKPTELGAPLVELTLNPGDVLYLPRGFPHAAEAADDPSDHLTIGISAITEYRMAKRALEQAVNKGTFRSALPTRSLDGPAHPPTLPAIDTDDTWWRRWMVGAIWRRMPQTRLRPRTTPTTLPERVILTPGPLLWLTSDSHRATLGFGNRTLTMPAEAHPYLAAIIQQGAAFDPLTIDGLDTDSRRVVTRRLVDVGILSPP